MHISTPTPMSNFEEGQHLQQSFNQKKFGMLHEAPTKSTTLVSTTVPEIQNSSIITLISC